MSQRKLINWRPIDRRQWLKAAGLSLAGASASGWLPALAGEVAADPRRRRQCVLLWMTGGPSQIDTFDMKPDHANGGEFKEVATNVPGLRFSEHLPKLAKQADRLAVVRGLSTKEGDHGRGTYLMRTGQRPEGPIRFPCMGSALSKELAGEDLELPSYVSILPYSAVNWDAFGPGFLGPAHSPLTVAASDNPAASVQISPEGYAELTVDDLELPEGVDREQFEKRVKLWKRLQKDFLSKHQSGAPMAHHTIYQRALRLMDGDVAEAFDLTEERTNVRDAYGRGQFGQACLMARRMVERGVPFVEVTLGSFVAGSANWDTHQNNFATVKQLSEQLDSGWSALMRELGERGLLDTTTILWMGEFGRTPGINKDTGRDHFPSAWTCVFAGGGIQGGAVYGKTSADGATVEEGKADAGDVLATLCAALGIPPDTENTSDVGRPVPIAKGKPIQAILA